MRIVKIGLLMLIVSNVIGCGSMDPAATDTDTETDSIPIGDGGADGDTDADADTDAINDYYPMAVGDFWTYRETEGLLETEFTYAITGTDTIDFGRDTGERTVFLVENSAVVSTAATDEGRMQYIENMPDRAVRHRQDIFDATGTFTKQRDFFPGFLRFDRTKIALGTTWTETLTRVSDPKDGSTPFEEEVSYDYEILNTNTQIDIDGKTYNCLQVKRTARSDAEVKYYWYAKGIGKVQELTGSSKMEQLIDSSYF